MNFKKLTLGLAFLAAALLVLVFGPAATGSQAADHLDAPLVTGDGRIDINDVYAFVKGPDTVLVMTINPVAGVLSPTTLKPGVHYEFAIDNNGDALEDIVFRVQASAPNPNGIQNVIMHRAGNGLANAMEEGGMIVARGRSEQTISVRGGGSLFIGLRDDPFFFDLVGFQTGTFCAPGSDFFAGLNVTAIVLQVPTASLLGNSSSIGVWARTEVDDVQVERMGRPVINTVLIPSASKDAFNATQPMDDPATWTAAVTASLVALNGDPAYSAVVAGILLPDILTIDTANPSSYLNGRALADDVIDLSLAVVTNGALTTDCVNGNDVPFLAVFPYLAPSH